MIRRICFLMGLVVCSSMASAQYMDFALTGGYSHMYPERDGGLFFDKDGAYVDANFAYRLPGLPVPIFAGVGVTASGYWDSQSSDIFFLNNNNNSNNFGFNQNLYSDVELIEAEPRLAVKLVIPGLQGFYIRPQIGAGLLVDNYSVDTVETINNVSFIHTLYHTGAAFDIRPDVEAGWSLGRTSFGMDISYMAAFGGFGQMGDVLQELRVGAFVRFRY
jgi:hypothetical protein